MNRESVLLYIPKYLPSLLLLGWNIPPSYFLLADVGRYICCDIPSLVEPNMRCSEKETLPD